MLILGHFQRGEWQWIGSQIVRHEIAQTPDSQRRRRVALMADSIDEVVAVAQHELQRAQQLEKLGFQSLDALTLAVRMDIMCVPHMTWIAGGETRQPQSVSIENRCMAEGLRERSRT